MFPNSGSFKPGPVPTVALLALTTKRAVLSVISRGTTVIGYQREAKDWKELGRFDGLVEV